MNEEYKHKYLKYKKKYLKLIYGGSFITEDLEDIKTKLIKIAEFKKRGEISEEEISTIFKNNLPKFKKDNNIEPETKDADRKQKIKYFNNLLSALKIGKASSAPNSEYKQYWASATTGLPGGEIVFILQKKQTESIMNNINTLIETTAAKTKVKDEARQRGEEERRRREEERRQQQEEEERRLQQEKAAVKAAQAAQEAKAAADALAAREAATRQKEEEVAAAKTIQKNVRANQRRRMLGVLNTKINTAQNKYKEALDENIEDENIENKSLKNKNLKNIIKTITDNKIIYNETLVKIDEDTSGKITETVLQNAIVK